KVHGRPALVRLRVQRRTFLHVMRNIGDVNAKPEMAVRKHLEADRVVEVASVFSIDGHDGQWTKIGPAPEIFFADRPADAASLFNGFGTMLVGDAVLADDDLVVDAGLVD